MSRSKLAKDNLSDLELYDEVYSILEKMCGEPSNTGEVAEVLKSRGFNINKHRIPDVVKNPPYRGGVIPTTYIKYKLMSARSDYRMMVYWV